MEVLFVAKMGLEKLKWNRRWRSSFEEVIYIQTVVELTISAEQPGGLRIKDSEGGVNIVLDPIQIGFIGGKKVDDF